MAEVTKPFDLIIDIKKPVVNEPFEVTEGDNGNILIIEIQKDGSPVDLTDCLITVVFSHSEKTFEQDSDTIGGDVTVSGTNHNIVTVVLHSSSYAPDGITECEIKIASGATQSTWITTPPFTIKSRRALLNNETITAVVEFPILQTLITRVEGLEAREQANWTETDDQLVTFIRNKPVVGTNFQDATQNLTAETTLSDTDTVPFYDASASAHRKSTWANIVSKIRTALFGSVTGVAKLDGAGNVAAAVANTDYAAAEHASRHAEGAEDEVTPTSIKAIGFNSAQTLTDAQKAFAASNSYTVPANSIRSNLIINGGFSISQRGTTFANPANGAYTLDRWRIVYNGTGATRAISQQTFTIGQTNVPNEPFYFARLVDTVAASGETLKYFAQKIEDVRTLAGESCTVSFYAKADAERTMPVLFTQAFGSGGSVSIETAAQNAVLSTAWTKFAFTFAIPSISGKSIGAGSALDLRFYLPGNSTYSIDISNVQLNPGTVEQPFVKEPHADNLRKCLRYYLGFPSAYIIGRASGITANDVYVQLPTPVPLRIAPTFVGTLNTDLLVRTIAGVGQSGFTAAYTLENNCIQIQFTKTSHGLTDAQGVVLATGAFDAEL